MSNQQETEITINKEWFYSDIENYWGTDDADRIMKFLEQAKVRHTETSMDKQWFPKLDNNK